MKFPAKVLCVLCASVVSLVAVDTINDPIITEAFLRTAVASDRLANALTTFAAGNFRGYQPALDNPYGNATTGCHTLEPELDENGQPVSIVEYLLQNIVVDKITDQPTRENPLSYNATTSTVRKQRPGDRIPYVGSTYIPNLSAEMPDPENEPDPGQHQRRFTIPFPVSASDAGAEYPVILGIRDQSPKNNVADYNTLGEKDGLSFLCIFPDYAAYVGSFAYGQEKYSFSYGAGIAAPDILGAHRFARGSYPNPVPKMGSLWWANFLLKSYAITEEEMADSPDTRQGNLVPQFQAGKRIMYSYGRRGKQTKPLDTIVVFAGLNRTNRLGDAPLINNPSTGCERIYNTREFGYACRWELWASENDTRVSEAVYPGHPDAPALAVYWWKRNEGGMPADMAGNYTAHFRAGNVREVILETDADGNPTAGYYTHTQTITDPDTGYEETLNWYLIGVHDMTDIRDLVKETKAPVDAFALAPISADNPYFLKSFGFQRTVNWTGNTNADFTARTNWDSPVTDNATLLIQSPLGTTTSPSSLSALADTTAAPHLSLEIATANSTRGNLTINNATLNPAGSIILANGSNSAASLTATNAALSTTHAFASMQRYSAADITLTDTTLSAAYQFELARNGTANLTANNATLSITNLRAASKRHSTANIDLADTTLSIGSTLILAGEGTAIATLSNTTVTNATSSGTVITIANTRTSRANITLSRDTRIYSREKIHIATNGTANITLSGNSSLEARTYLHLADNGTANITATGTGTLLNATRDIFAAKNGTLTFSLADNARATSRNFTAAGGFTSTTNTTTNTTTITTHDGTLSLNLTTGAAIIGSQNITLSETPRSTATVNIDNATLATSHSTLGTMSLATNGTLSLTADNNARITSGNLLQIAATETATANIALLGNSTLAAKTLVIGQGKTNISLRPRQAADIPISVSTLITHSIPILSIDCSEFPLPSANQSTLTLIQSTNPSATPAFDLRPTNIPKNHDISIDWSADKKSLTATLRRITPDLATQDDHLLYALTDNYTLTNDNRPTANGSLSHLPKLRLHNNTLTYTYTPKRTSYTYEVQQSADLQNWTTLQTLTPNATQTLEEQIYETTTNADRLFLRLKITPNQNN